MLEVKLAGLQAGEAQQPRLQQRQRPLLLPLRKLAQPVAQPAGGSAADAPALPLAGDTLA